MPMPSPVPSPMQSPVQSGFIEVTDDAAALEACYAQGWTDGLPVIPPTEERIQSMLAAAGRNGEEILGGIPERNRVITAEKLAINAVMAGCLPEYAPVVFAAMEAMTNPTFGLHGPATSTSGMAILLIVNGPIVQSIGMNARDDVFGTGNRANATIGRAIRLALRNVFASRAGELDRSTLGTPAKFSFCIAENEADSPWEPLHVQRGLDQNESAVTVVAGEGPRQVNDHHSRDPQGILANLADALSAAGTFNFQSPSTVVLAIGQEHMRTISDAGWSKRDIQEYVYERAKRSIAERKRLGIEDGAVAPNDETSYRRMVRSPEHVLVVAAGGPAGRFSSFIPCFGNQAVTRAIPALERSMD